MKIAICRSVPKWYEGPVYQKIAPTLNILGNWHNHHDEQEYMLQYILQVLNHTSQKEVFDDLTQIANGAENIILLCYEKSDDFCHRHLFNKWMNKAGFNCKEYKGE